MQTTSSGFRKIAAGHVRPLSWGVKASFDKAFDAAITLFKLDESLLDGPDLLAPSSDQPVQLWDKYSYLDYSERAISVEVTREESQPYSITQAYADVVMNNYDNFFTPNSGSPIQANILPRRPFRLLLGFNGESVAQIVGLSQGMPAIDKTSRTASFHIVDFMSYLLSQDISETTILQNVKTHEVLDYLFQHLGLLDSQYSLDGSLNTIKFFYVEKGTKFGTVADKLMEAEIGRLFMDETGVIRFRNRYDYDTTPVYTFDKSNVIDYSVSDETQIINSVKITSDVRAVQASQSIWTSLTPVSVPVGGQAVVWAEFADPVTSATTPIYSPEENNTSYFTSTLDEDGSTPYADISVNLELFSKSAKMTFTNTGSSFAYITDIGLYGTPAKITETIRVEEIDQDSINNFEEQPYTIDDNPYIQDRSNAQSRALILLRDFAGYGSGLQLDVKGSPALQLGDTVDVDLDGYQGDYILTRIANIVSGKYTQRLLVQHKDTPIFFELDTSTLNGADVLAP